MKTHQLVQSATIYHEKDEKEEIQNYKLGDIYGFATTYRGIIRNLLYDTNTDISDFPYNFNDFILKMELEQKVITVKVKTKENNKLVAYNIQIQYILHDSI